jgi:hypothetical protein
VSGQVLSYQKVKASPVPLEISVTISQLSANSAYDISFFSLKGMILLTLKKLEPTGLRYFYWGKM